jgi:transposase-like protein
MKAIFTQSFKIQAVEKALSRSDVTSLKEVSDTLGVGYSTLHKWIVNLRNQDFKSVSTDGMLSVGSKVKEKKRDLRIGTQKKNWRLSSGAPRSVKMK